MAESILQKVAAGDRAAMRECVDRFGGLVWSLARRLASSEAEDAMQEIFVEVWKSAGRFDPAQGSEATFVAMIARRRVIDRLRGSQTSSPVVPLIDSVPDFSASPATELGRSEEVGEILRAIDMLGREHQRVLVLAIQRGLTHEQIAVATGLPLGTVKTNIRRGLTRIRDLLRDRQVRGQTPSGPNPGLLGSESGARS